MPSNEEKSPWDELIRIGAEDLDTETVLAQLYDNYQAHDWPQRIPTHAFMVTDRADRDTHVDERFLLYQLEHLNMTLTLDMQPSGVPVLGPLIDAFKRSMHQLVLFYVNKVAARIATANMIQTRLLHTLYEKRIWSKPRDEP
jgi:hypothetical protein